MRPQLPVNPAVSLIDTAQFRKLVQIDGQHAPDDPERNRDDDLTKTDRLRKLDLPELADELDDDPGFDPYNSASNRARARADRQAPKITPEPARS